jgi:hypothetical protein
MLIVFSKHNIEKTKNKQNKGTNRKKEKKKQNNNTKISKQTQNKKARNHEKV